ncbi:ABC transporter sub-family C-like protein 3, partial [Sarcoptes scabiei]
ETLSGVTSIRAYAIQEEFIEKINQNVDKNNSLSIALIIANRWLGIRLELIANFIVLFAAIFAVIYRNEMDPSSVGLIISYALSTTQNLNFLVRTATELETKEGSELVLKQISTSIRSCERIGIVGRTGAGKSSLTLALFRLIEPVDGTIKIDGVNISKIGLHQLRRCLTIIPQDPVLFSGTIRSNLDPFDKFTDEQLWRCLEQAHLKRFVQSLDSNLQYKICESGTNLSVGQRQLICLARALLRKTKILVLDEATAAVDLETDSLIQETIKQSFNDCTILTIAHRLNTILDYDRILVLNGGKIAEFDSPENLLSNSSSIFYSMVNSHREISNDD